MATNMMTNYELQPTAPLVFGVGRPSGFGLGGDSRQFPLPSVVAGALRAARAAQLGHGPNPEADAVKDLEVGPPLLLWRRHRQAAGGNVSMPMWPRPADCLAVMREERKRLIRLVPGAASGRSDLQSPHGTGSLLPVPKQPFKEKPAGLPPWWSRDLVLKWLTTPDTVADAPGENDAVDHLALDTRTHAGIEDASKAAAESLLYRTAGVDFGGRSKALRAGEGEVFSLQVSAAAEQLHGLQRRVGGEGRVCHVRLLQVNAADSGWNQVQQQLKRIDKDSVFRVMLLSPAVFNEGWLPDGLDASSWQGSLAPGGGRVQLLCAAIDRMPVHSGWVKGQPGQPFRVVPAGTVYWFKALETIEGSLLWNRSLCQAGSDWARSGWGYAVWGRA
jgi:CRISPR-associated protein Cmr3